MSERFIKLSRSERTEWLLENHPNAFLLLTQIALRARRTSNSPDGYEIGECHIGDYEAAGICSEKAYRTAKDVLSRERAIKICETCRNRKKGATGRATFGTKVKLLNSEFYDINEEDKGDRKGDRGATEGRPKGDEQECKNDKNERKINNISPIFPKRAKEVHVSDDDHSKLVKDLTIEVTQECYQYLSQWKENNPKQAKKFNSDIGRIRKWVINAVREEKIKNAELDQRENRLKNSKENSNEAVENEKFIHRIAVKYQSPFYRLDINGLGVEFTPLKSADSTVIFLKYTEKGFKDQFDNLLAKKGFAKV